MKKVMDGCSAVANIAYKFSEIASIYPITPASPMASSIDARSSRGEKNLFGSRVDVVEMQSEAGAAGAMHGALASGALATSFTASQGLLLMIPNMYKIAGEELPGVIHVASRTVATHALSIFGDHSDIYATRETGFCILASSSVQEAHDLAAVAHTSAIRSSLPFLHFMDGFRTSHEINKINVLEDETLANLIDTDALKKFRNRALNINNPMSMGMAENEDIYFQSVEARNVDYDLVPEIVERYMNEINKVQGTDYKTFNYYGADNAKYVIVAMGSVTSTIRSVVEDLNKKGGSYGVVEVHLYRPFSMSYLKNALPTSVKRIAVLDRTREHGSIGEPLYLDVLSSLKDTNIDIYGGRYGLASKNTTPRDIYSVFMMLEEHPKNNFTVGIEDDVSMLSLPIQDYELKDTGREIVVYGYGSDGMVSASKDLLKIVGNDEKEYVQGYFEYDSKKSGGVTVSHLRFDETPIDKPYYAENPNIIIVTKDTYLNKFDVTKNIRENGLLVVSTKSNFEDLNKLSSINNAIKNKNLTVFTIDAEEISRRNNLGNKISIIFEAIMLRLCGVDDYEESLISSIKDRFKTKGEDVVNSNIQAMKEAIAGLSPYKGSISIEEEHSSSLDVIDKINLRRGNELTVADLMDYRTGAFPGGLTKFEKRYTSNIAPKWKSENCIQCGMCSLVCPHAVIRPFIVDKDEASSEGGISLIGSQDDKYKFVISVSETDCTGCGLCVSVCPGKGGEKALVMGDVDIKKQKLANTLFNFYENPRLYDKFTIKGSQLEKPKFEFSGACAGCGETPYLKILTQLFGDKLIIANATGCSSIYGGSTPSTPYSVPWANSLFEDNAEFGYGILKAYTHISENIERIMKENLDTVDENTRELFEAWIDNKDDLSTTKKVAEELDYEKIPQGLVQYKDYLSKPSIWAVGGDGWAYDIGFGGIDHVLSSGENINILVLDTEVYSNTGGQKSKSSRQGQVAEFADAGKRTPKKDLFRYAIGIPNVYVANISLGSNMFQTIKAFKEAEEHDGPSLIIAYSPCIEQGIRRGMSCAVEEEKLAVECGYLTLMRYDGSKLYIDSKEPDFDKYAKFLEGEIRYNSLLIKNPAGAKQLLEENKHHAMEQYTYYKRLSEEAK